MGVFVGMVNVNVIAVDDEIMKGDSDVVVDWVMP